jgi:hypothetical protein
MCVRDADCLLTASAGAGAAAVCEKFPWSAFLSLFSHLAFFLSLGSFARQTRSRAIKFRGAIFINYGMPAGPIVLSLSLCFASFFGACFGLCVFAAEGAAAAARW